MTEQDGSFRRLVETIKQRQTPPRGRPGRPPKHRTATTGHFYVSIYNRMKALSRRRTSQADHLVSISDLYNEAARVLVTDLHALLGDTLRLPAGAVTVPGVLGLREMVDRPMYVPLRDLELQGEQKRTTLHLDETVYDALLELSLRFGLQMRKAIHMHRLLELAAAWYLSGIESVSD